MKATSESGVAFPSGWVLFQQAWSGFTSRWAGFLGLVILSFVPFVLILAARVYIAVTRYYLDLSTMAASGTQGLIVAGGIQTVFWVVLMGSLASVVFITIPATCAQLVFVRGMTKRGTAVQAFRQSFPLLPRYVAVAGLLSLATTLGTVAFFVPGVVVAVWFGLALVVVVFEDASILEAFKKSRALAEGFFHAILLRWVFFFGVVLAVQAVLTLLIIVALNLPLPSGVLFPLILGLVVLRWLWSLLLLPLWFLYQYTMYAHLRRIKKNAPDARYRVAPATLIAIWSVLVLIVVFVGAGAYYERARLSQTLQEQVYDRGF